PTDSAIFTVYGAHSANKEFRPICVDIATAARVKKILPTPYPAISREFHKPHTSPVPICECCHTRSKILGSILPVASSIGNNCDPPATCTRAPPYTDSPSRDSTIKTKAAGLYIHSSLDEVTFLTPIDVST